MRRGIVPGSPLGPHLQTAVSGAQHHLGGQHPAPRWSAPPFLRRRAALTLRPWAELCSQRSWRSPPPLAPKRLTRRSGPGRLYPSERHARAERSVPSASSLRCLLEAVSSSAVVTRGRSFGLAPSLAQFPLFGPALAVSERCSDLLLSERPSEVFKLACLADRGASLAACLAVGSARQSRGHLCAA